MKPHPSNQIFLVNQTPFNASCPRYLSNPVPQQYQRLDLEKMQVVTCDKKKTALLFRCRGSSIKVIDLGEPEIPTWELLPCGAYANHQTTFTYHHPVPSNILPITRGATSCEMRYLTKRTRSITVIDHDGHHLYPIDRRQYEFPTLAMRQSFHALARGREILADFDPQLVTSFQGKRKECLAKSQVVHLWSWHRSGFTNPTVTMTFLAKDQVHVEWHVNDFHSDPDLVKSKSNKWTIKLCYNDRVPGAGEEVTFHSKRGAL
jgi:hypothetical protein